MADSFTLKAILSAVDNLTPTLKAVQAQAQVARKYLGDVGTSINAFTSKFGLSAGIVSTIAAGFGVAAIKKAVVGFADLSVEIQKGALKTGMSNAQFQRMKYVAEQAHVPIESLEMSMGKLNKNLGTAGDGGNQKLVDLLKELKIPLLDVNGKVREGADMLPDLAEAFQRNTRGVAQAKIGNIAFGRSFQEMLPLLSEGRKGLADSLASFEKFKGVISDDDLKAGTAFSRQLQNLNIVLKGFQMTIAKELVPVLTPLIQQLAEWWAANKKLVGQEVKKMVQELVVVLKQVDWMGFVKGVGDAAKGIGEAIDKVGGLRNALIAVAVIMNAQTIFAIGGIIASLGRLGLAAIAASKHLGLVAVAQAGVAEGLTGSLASAAKSAGLLAAAALVGVAIGTAISAALEGTKVGDQIGHDIAEFLALFGNQEAKAALEINAQAAKSPSIVAATDVAKAPATATTVAAIKSAATTGVVEAAKAPAVRVAGTFGANSGVGAVAQSAAALLPPTPTTRPGTLGSGSFNLNPPAAATVGGSVTVSFKDAPPGMRVEQTQASNPRVPIRTDVGYRFSAAMGY